MSVTCLENKRRFMRAIGPIVGNYAYNDFRRYRAITRYDQNEYLLNDISRILKEPRSAAFVFTGADKALGFAVLRRLGWDSGIIGRNMWQIPYLAAEGCYPENVKIKIALLRTILEYAVRAGEAHISCRVDAADIASIHALEEVKFKLMDTVVTWLFKPSAKIPRFKDIYKIRNFRKTDLNDLMKLARHRFLTNRFYMDPAIPGGKADELYAAWIKNYCLDHARGKARVRVAEGRNGIAGFAGYRLKEEMRRISGCKIIGQGLMAARPSARGASISLINAAIRDVISDYDFAEFDAVITNHEAVKIYEAFNFKIIRAKHTFHYNAGH